MASGRLAAVLEAGTRHREETTGFDPWGALRINPAHRKVEETCPTVEIGRLVGVGFIYPGRYRMTAELVDGRHSQGCGVQVRG